MPIMDLRTWFLSAMDLSRSSAAVSDLRVLPLPTALSPRRSFLLCRGGPGGPRRFAAAAPAALGAAVAPAPRRRRRGLVVSADASSPRTCRLRGLVVSADSSTRRVVAADAPPPPPRTLVATDPTRRRGGPGAADHAVTPSPRRDPRRLRGRAAAARPGAATRKRREAAAATRIGLFRGAPTTEPLCPPRRRRAHDTSEPSRAARGHGGGAVGSELHRLLEADLGRHRRRHELVEAREAQRLEHGDLVRVSRAHVPPLEGVEPAFWGEMTRRRRRACARIFLSFCFLRCLPTGRAPWPRTPTAAPRARWAWRPGWLRWTLHAAARALNADARPSSIERPCFQRPWWMHQDAEVAQAYDEA